MTRKIIRLRPSAVALRAMADRSGFAGQVGTKDPDILNSLAALKRAAKRALREGLETGTPVWVIKNGRMVDLTRGKRCKGRKGRARK